MSKFVPNSRGLFLAAAASLLCGAAAPSAMPDFSPNGETGWIAMSNDYIPSPTGPKPVSFDPAHPYVPNGRGEQPTFRISDVNHPNLKPWASKQMKRDNANVLAGKIAYTARSSCMPSGVPDFMAFIVEPIYFVQSAKEVLMIYSGDQQVRHIHMNMKHSAKPAPSWYGEAVGHYEGDTLVIDTIGMNAKTYVDNYRTPHTEKLHVVERWKLINDGKVLQVDFSVDDPDTFKQPWSATQRYRRVKEEMTEQVCAENNNNTAVFDYHMPVAAKADF